MTMLLFFFPMKKEREERNKGKKKKKKTKTRRIFISDVLDYIYIGCPGSRSRSARRRSLPCRFWIIPRCCSCMLRHRVTYVCSFFLFLPSSLPRGFFSRRQRERDREMCSELTRHGRLRLFTKSVAGQRLRFLRMLCPVEDEKDRDLRRKQAQGGSSTVSTVSPRDRRQW